MDMGALRGLMAAPTAVTSTTITLRDREPITGVTSACIKASGRITRWKATACSSGLTVADTRASTSTTRKRAMVSSYGQMGADTRANG